MGLAKTEKELQYSAIIMELK